jgi:Carboxypeptidase regulatory-like domain/TonB-dependent Receptor Plug Domain
MFTRYAPALILVTLFIPFALGPSWMVPCAQAQGITTGTISGVVVDPSGAAIPNAQIVATSNNQGGQRQVIAGPSGEFSLHAVPIGQYALTVSASGFTAVTVTNVEVNSGATTALKSVQLKLGANTQQVEVNGSSEVLLQTSDSQVTTTFSSQIIQNIPLNNGFDTAAELIPGVASTHGDGFSNTNGDNYSVNGQSGRYNNSEIDGQANNDNSIGGPQFFFANQDAVQELQVVTNNFSAQYGRNAGAVINYITKNGTNALHGSGFEFYQGQQLSSFANPQKNPLFGFCAPGQSPSTGCTVPALPRYVENRYGGTLGGPILKDKLFFFGSTYWDRVRQGAAAVSSLPGLTPDPTGLQTLQSAFPGNPAVTALITSGPYGVKAGNPVPTNITTETVTGPGGVTVPVEFGAVQRSIPTLFNDQEHLGRLDYQPTGRDHLFLRYIYQNQLVTGIGGGEAGQIANGAFVDSIGGTHSIGADWTHSFNDHWVDQLRYSFQQGKAFFQGGSYPNCTTTNITTCPAQLLFFGQSNDLGYGENTVFPQGRTVKVTQVQNNATWTHGNHTVVFGGEFDYQNSPNVGLFNYNGVIQFQDFSDYLQNGAASQNSQQPAFTLIADGNPVIPFTESDVAAYVQDDWKVTPTFTAHIGLRWEYFGQALNKLHDQTVARESNPATAFWDPTLPLAARTDPSADEYFKGFEPRLGFAWNPNIDKKLVLRGGYAINQNPAYYNLFLLAAGAAPVVNFGGTACSGGACLPASGSILGAAVRATNLPFLPKGPGIDPRSRFQQYFPTNFRPPYVQTYTLAIEHQIGNAAVAEIRYVGSKTTHDFQSNNNNPFLANVAAAFPNFVSPSSLCQDPNANGFGRPDCNFGDQALITNGGFANYNGLLLNLTTRNYHGLTSTISYTYSKNLGNVTDGFRSTGGAGSSIAYPQNPFNPGAGEYGLSGNDFPNVVSFAFDYQFPKFVAGNSWLSRLTNGFALSSVYRFNSGQVYTPFQNLTLDTNTGDTSFCDGGFAAQTVGADFCRLAVSNRKAPINTIAYLNPFTGPNTGTPTPGTPQYVVYGSDGFDNNGIYQPGTPVDPASAHWIVNNQAYAMAVGNPYPGSARSLLRGPTYNDLDATILKTTRITERVSLQLSFAAYNALNQKYLPAGISTANVGSSTFAQVDANPTPPSLVPNGTGSNSGNRFAIIGGKIIF